MKWPSGLRYIDIYQSAGPSPRPNCAVFFDLSLEYMWKVDFISVFAVRTHLSQCLFQCLDCFDCCLSLKWIKWTSYRFLSIGMTLCSSTLLRCTANTESNSRCQTECTDIYRSDWPSASDNFTLHLNFLSFFLLIESFVCLFVCLSLSVYLFASVSVSVSCLNFGPGLAWLVVTLDLACIGLSWL